MQNIKIRFKGWLGEAGVKIFGALGLPATKYHKFHNVTIPNEYTKSTSQIDHIIVSRYGVFVVETKMMTGWIFGSEYDKQWTQKFPSKSFKFQNPLRQNYGHIKALQEILTDIPEEVFENIISMCGEHKIKTAMPKNVTRGAWYISYIRSFKTVRLTDQQVALAVEAIKTNRLPDNAETKKQHIANIKQNNNKSVEQ
ncbi:MAG: nuclease-related domain-containing protein [Thiopseudomonas sp.]